MNEEPHEGGKPASAPHPAPTEDPSPTASPTESTTASPTESAAEASAEPTPETPAGSAADSPAGEPGPYPEGTPCWLDAQLSDVEGGKRFYGDLFGWSFQEGEAGSVWATLDGRPVAQLGRKADGRMPTVWTVYFATPDIQTLGRRITATGGRLVVTPYPVAELGRAALAADPEGAVFGLWQARRHPGFGVRHEPGTFVWAELYTRDTTGANTFYGGLFHHALFAPGADPDFGRADVTDVFPAEMPPHILAHFRVTGLDEALGTVRRLGGRVQAPPFEASYGRVAVVTDNQGASFALLER